MTKTLITLPCTARELENALHAACDHDGLWGAKVRVVPPREGRNPDNNTLAIETEEKEGQRFCGCCANKDCGAKGAIRVVVCNDFK